MGKLIRFMILIIIILSALVASTMVIDFIGRQSKSLARDMLISKGINGVNIQNVTIAKSKLQLPATLIWQGIEMTLFTDKQSLFSNQKLNVVIPRLEIRITGFLENQCNLFIPRIDITPLSPGAPASPERRIEGLENGRIDLDFKFNFFHPFTAKDQLTSTLYSLSPLFSKGSTPVPLDFSGILLFSIKSDPLRAKVYTKRRPDGYYALQINEEFFQTIAWYNTYEITDAEAKVLSQYPFRMPGLVNIMAEAKEESKRMAKIRDIPEDAYRHILWSYLLTRSYGPEFAKQVTDAHEIGDLSNTEADHQMDYHNNAIGRQYAQKNYKKHEILTQLLNDKNVIRKPVE